MAFENWRDYLDLVQLIMYGLMLLLCLFQFGRIFYHRHQLISFHSVFLLFCFLWMLLRVILYSLTVSAAFEDPVTLPSPTAAPIATTEPTILAFDALQASDDNDDDDDDDTLLSASSSSSSSHDGQISQLLKRGMDDRDLNEQSEIEKSWMQTEQKIPAAIWAPIRSLNGHKMMKERGLLDRTLHERQRQNQNVPNNLNNNQDGLNKLQRRGQDVEDGETDPEAAPTEAKNISTEAEDIPDGIYYPLAWLPLSLEFATYTLLILFFARVSCKLDPTTKSQWESHYRTRYFTMWGVINLIFFLADLTFIILVCTGDIKLASVQTAAVRFLAPAVLFLCLSILFGYYGIKLYRQLQDPRVRYVPFNIQGATTPGITVLTVLLIVVFMCRMIYCFVISFEVLKHGAFFGEEPLFRFMSLFISEILPTFSILMFFRRIPTSGSKKRQLLPPVFYSSIQTDDQDYTKSSFFNDPQRYDSDEDRTSPNQSDDAYSYGQSLKTQHAQSNPNSTFTGNSSSNPNPKGFKDSQKGVEYLQI